MQIIIADVAPVIEQVLAKSLIMFVGSCRGAGHTGYERSNMVW
jgi:hypothetical protein